VKEEIVGGERSRCSQRPAIEPRFGFGGTGSERGGLDLARLHQSKRSHHWRMVRGRCKWENSACASVLRAGETRRHGEPASGGRSAQPISVFFPRSAMFSLNDNPATSCFPETDRLALSQNPGARGLLGRVPPRFLSSQPVELSWSVPLFAATLTVVFRLGQSPALIVASADTTYLNYPALC
jgi:hypothetical protein